VSVDVAQVDQLGRKIRGPSALGGDAGRFLHLTWTLAVTEFKLRFFGSVLGYFWQLMRPILMFGTLYVVFTEFVRLNDPNTPYLPVVMLTGIVLYTFLNDATGAAVSSLVDRENLVRKIHFPRMVIPLAVALVAFFNFVLNMLALFVFMAIQGVDVHSTWIQFPVIVLALAFFAVGMAMLLSALYVRFRDVQPIWEVVLQAMFYASPVIYVIETIPRPDLQQVVMCNPLAAVIVQTRHALLDPNAPTASQAIGSDVRLLIPAGIVLFVFVVGFWLFNREAPRIAEEL
jgi:ABC-2 type transport system permease protein